MKYKNEIRFYRNFIEPGDLCFDVGANIGNKVDIFRKLQAKVVAIEPQPICANHLEKRFLDDKNVKILRVALGDKIGTSQMYICNDINVLSTLSQKWIKKSRFSSNKKVNWDSVINVDLMTLDRIIDKYGTPKFCKIDVEGFEIEVLSGLSKKIEYLSFEFMYEFLDDVQTICSILGRIGNFNINYSIRDSFDFESFSLRGWRSYVDVVNELKLVGDDTLWGDIYLRFD